MASMVFRLWEKQDRARFRAVTELAQSSFVRFGEYRDFIGQLMLYDGITTGMLLDAACPEGNDVAGFVIAGIVPLGKDSQMQGNILAIALAEPYRYRKLGGYLLQQGILIIQDKSQKYYYLYGNVESIGLTVAPDNHPAIRLFSRFGFTFVPETEKHYYASGVQACEMTRPLHLPSDKKPDSDIITI